MHDWHCPVHIEGRKTVPYQYQYAGKHKSRIVLMQFLHVLLRRQLSGMSVLLVVLRHCYSDGRS